MRKTVFVLKGYPRLSETFIAQEILGLERAGMDLVLVALRRPGDHRRHPIHDEINAPVIYLPEYLHDDIGRVFRAAIKCLSRPGLLAALGAFLRDAAQDFTRNRFRRLGQALVLAAELPDGASWLHAHFLHTPASVTAYASRLTGLKWSASAHAKDIWTSPEWELRRKLSLASGVAVCTRSGFERLRALALDPSRVHLSYHGLDLDRYAPFAGRRPPRDGKTPADPLTILSVGRAVPKKGLDVLLRALAILKPSLSFRFVHAGGGEDLPKLKSLADSLGLADRIDWRGPLAQDDVLALYRQADIFALACRISADGDRDGLPNVLVEAASQGLACVSTAVSGVPELLTDGETGRLVAPDDPQAFAAALAELAAAPDLRERLGQAAERRVRQAFDHRASIRQLVALFASQWQSEA